MSLSYIYITQLGNSIGAMSLPTVTGNLVSDDPIWFGWMVLIVSVSCLVFEILIHLQGKIVLKKFEDSHQEIGKSVENPAFEEEKGDENDVADL
jgi:hypothetical protein